MANPTMDRDDAAWLRQRLQKAQADLLREEATTVQELIGAAVHHITRHGTLGVPEIRTV